MVTHAQATTRTAKRFAVYCVDMPGQKVTQQILANLAGVTQPTISAIINGRPSVTSRSKEAALEALNRLRKERGLVPITHDDVIWTF